MPPLTRKLTQTGFLVLSVYKRLICHKKQMVFCFSWMVGVSKHFADFVELYLFSCYFEVKRMFQWKNLKINDLNRCYGKREMSFFWFLVSQLFCYLVNELLVHFLFYTMQISVQNKKMFGLTNDKKCINSNIYQRFITTSRHT